MTLRRRMKPPRIRQWAGADTRPLPYSFTDLLLPGSAAAIPGRVIDRHVGGSLFLR